MEVTLDNYDQMYSDIIARIGDCDFYSMDCELSGITNYKDLNCFDTPKNRYDKMKKNDQNYLILQLGLCFFKHCKEEDCYETSAYNIFLFPRSQNCKYSKDGPFSCLNSSIEFLCEQNFDFNKVFKKGISFMSKDCEESVRDRLEKTLEDRKKPKSTLYPSNNKDIREKIDALMLEIDEFYANESETKKEIKFTDFLLRVFVEKNLKQKYTQKLKYEYKFLENKERLMTLVRIDASEQNQFDERAILEKEIGFSKIIWELSKSEKLVVGHNMLTDLMQILRQFFSSTLPENYEDFRSMANALFPKIIDTKYMACMSPLKELISNSALGDMDKILAKEPFPSIKLKNSDYSTDDEKLHEAGYDAFLTGVCYLRMIRYLQSFNSNKQSMEEFYLNKIFLMKNYDLNFIDLKKAQDEPKRDNVFYVEFPPNWQTQDIFDLFSPFGSVFVGWINEYSAFVAIQNADNVKKAAGQLVGVSGRDYRVYFYSTYINQLSKGKNNANKVAAPVVAVVTPNDTPNNTSTVENGKKAGNSTKKPDELNNSKDKRKRNEKSTTNSEDKQSSSDDSGSSQGSVNDTKKIKKITKEKVAEEATGNNLN